MLPCLTSGVMILPPPMLSARATGFSGRGFGLPWITALPSDAISSPRCPRMPGVTAPCSPISPDRAFPGVLRVASAGRAHGGPCAALGAAAVPGGDMVVSSGGPWSRHVDGCSTQCQAQRLTVLGFFFPPPYSSVRVLPCSLVRRWAPQLGAGGRLRWSQHSAGAGAAGDAGTCLGRFCSGLGAAGAASSAKGQENFGQVPVGGGGNIWGKTLPSHGPDLLGTGGGVMAMPPRPHDGWGGAVAPPQPWGFGVPRVLGEPLTPCRPLTIQLIVCDAGGQLA